MERKPTVIRGEPAPLGWAASFLWAAGAVACLHAAYASAKHPAWGLAMFGYALALVQLVHQPSVRRSFYFGLGTAFLCYAPQLWFFASIFNAAAAVLWIILSFWVGLFAALTCGYIRRWGWARAAWLIPVIWTGLEFFRSELYYLKFSWLNVGYAMPIGNGMLGMYGTGLLTFAAATAASRWRVLRPAGLASLAVVGVLLACLGLAVSRPSSGREPVLSIAGIQLEFPPENLIPRMLDRALARNNNAQIFVLSEYALNGPVPEPLKEWCRRHDRYLVVGGEAPATNGEYYNTVFVAGTNGDIVFQQAKCVPIQFFRDGLPAPEQRVWNSPWGKIGFCVCYDLSYRRVTDELVRQGAQLLIVPAMDVEDWGRHEHELHIRVAPVRAAEYGLPVFRLASSGISQAVSAGGRVIAEAPMPGTGAILAADLRLPPRGSLPPDRFLAPLCTGMTALLAAGLLRRRKPGPS
jgi:apolipoprotein N-acyltransferase